MFRIPVSYATILRREVIDGQQYSISADHLDTYVGAEELDALRASGRRSGASDIDTD